MSGPSTFRTASRQLVLGDVRDIHRRVAGEALGADEVEAGLVGEGLEVGNRDGVVGADDGDPLYPVAEGAERRRQRVGRLGDADIAAGAGPDAALDLARRFQPAAPDAFGRDAEDQMVGRQVITRSIDSSSATSMRRISSSKSSSEFTGSSGMCMREMWLVTPLGAIAS